MLNVVPSKRLYVIRLYLNTTIYNYFAENFGYVERLPDNSLFNKYIEDVYMTKGQQPMYHLWNWGLITYMFILKHQTVLGRPNDHIYVKKVINYDESILPTFNMDDCLKYFISVLTKINPNKIFQIPSWIPALDYPITAFDLEPPTYQQITNILIWLFKILYSDWLTSGP